MSFHDTSNPSGGVPMERVVDRSTPEQHLLDEIIRHAIKTEENAWRLYAAAAEATDDLQLGKILRAFAEVERGHKKRLEDLYGEKVLTDN